VKNVQLHRYLAIGLVLGLSASIAQAQTYTPLYNFDCVKNGCNPINPGLLAQGMDGNLYGTMPTQISGWGTVVEYVPSGTLTTLWPFQGNDGFMPQSGLRLGTDGNFYGTTSNGGSQHYGTVFQVSNGVVTPLYPFTNGADGAYPYAPPIQAPDGNIYGVTGSGKTPGTVYRITPSAASPASTFTVIANLPSATQAPLVLGSDGNLYGTTPYGGAYNGGTVFQLPTTGGTPNILHSFDSTVGGAANGYTPIGPVMMARDGKIYGTTTAGGKHSAGVVFQLTYAGAYTPLHSFEDDSQVKEGTTPTSGLVQEGDGLLYGVTSAGGSSGFGTLYKVDTAGITFAVLHNFDKASGGNPFSTPTLHTNGKLYGTTHTGGATNSSYGVLFSFDAGSTPNVSIVGAPYGKAGDLVEILGQGFYGATGVKFGSASASWFKILSDTYVIATVPLGATTGVVTVLEPGGNLTSQQLFTVPRPVLCRFPCHL
jgi:uncharacterized repeat protein (TIGR03803 family)